jgi:hypothetical protein
VIAATTITGDTPCRSTSVDYRLDTPSARFFLESYVSLPWRGRPRPTDCREALHRREIVPIKHPLTGRNYGQIPIPLLSS